MSGGVIGACWARPRLVAAGVGAASPAARACARRRRSLKPARGRHSELTEQEERPPVRSWLGRRRVRHCCRLPPGGLLAPCPGSIKFSAVARRGLCNK